MTSAACPSREELSVYIVGKLVAERSEEIDMHLQLCADCQASLETISAKSDTLLSGLYQRRQPGEFLDEPQCQQALVRVQQIGCDPSLTAREQLAANQESDFPQQIGPHRLLAKLGQGGMGTVYKALHTKLDRVVALKLLPEDRMRAADAVARFEREMKAVGKLDHPNIVRASDADEENGRHYLVMEYVDGIDLSELSRRAGRLRIADACELVRQAAVGLQHAHEHGLVHRDIKPSNLMLASSPLNTHPLTTHQVKILDLGLALLADTIDQAELTSSGQTMGTVDYMAPEQCGDSHSVDIRADIYSLGATLYKLLTGEPIFSGPNYQKPLQKFRALATESAPPIQSRRADIPNELAAVIAKMVAREPAHRYAAPAAAAAALAPFCSGADLMGLMMKQIGSGTHQPADAGRSPDAATLPNLSKSEVDTDRPSPQPAAEVVATPPQRPFRRRGVLALGGIAAVLAAVVIYWQTNKGTVQITISDPDIEVVLDDRRATFKGIDKQQHEIDVRAGDHGLKIIRGDLTFTTESFTLTRGETTLLEIKLVPGEVQVVRNGTAIIGRQALTADNVTVRRPPAFTNSLGMEFALIPQGKSWLGGGGGKPGDRAVEFNDDFYLGAYEVTQQEWEKVTGVNPSHFARHGAGKDVVKELRDAELQRFPVESVSYDDIQLFLVKLNELDKQSGWIYRLPKEDEWEYACRGGPMRDRFESAHDAYFDKPVDTLLPEHANFKYPDSLQRVCQVGQYPSNPLGLFDMIGNVWEMCDDAVTPDKVPPGRRMRGGFYGDKQDYCRAAGLGWAVPTHRSKDVGFRVARVRVKPADANHFTNSLGMEFVRIPKGKSWLGGGRGTPGDKEVQIQEDFYLGKYEVTQEEWQKLTGSNPSSFKAVTGVEPEDQKRFPVEQVLWDEAQDFLKRVNEKTKETGWAYRLPTVVEWEYACRGGPLSDRNQSAFDFYLERPATTLLPGQANFDFGENALKRPCKVGSYPPNHLGLCDMHGNVVEWCEDEQQVNGASLRAIRGGCWGYDAESCRAARPNTFGPSSRNHNIGLRLARVRVAAEPLADAGFVPLFNQRDLSGWTAKRSASIDWKNENGTITARNRLNTPNSAGQLSSKKEYKDFHFRCEVLAGSGVEPVIMFRNEDSLMKGQRRGYALTDPRPGSPVIAEGWGHGALYADDFQAPPHQSRLAPATEKDLGIKTGDWYRLEFIARGQRVEVRINGKQTATYDSADPVLNKAGSISLRCGAGANIAFRNLEIKELSAVDSPSVRLFAADPDRRAAEWVLSIGGAVKVDDGPTLLKTREELPREPFRLTTVGLPWNQKTTDEGWANLEGCQHVTMIELPHTPVTDAGIAYFKDCKGLVHLNLVDSKVTDVGLAVFKDRPELETLHIWNNRVTDAGMEFFKDCKKLRILGIRCPKVTDAGLAYFEGRDLERLELTGSAVTDRGLAYFKDCINLTWLDVSNTQISDDGLAHFKGCKKLGTLYAFGTDLTDAALVHLRGCRNLSMLELDRTLVTGSGLGNLKDCNLMLLSLTGTPFSDQHIELLGGLFRLKTIRLKGTKVTEASVKKLTALLPHCTIDWNGGVIAPQGARAPAAPPAAAEPDRRAAEWVLSIGGIVRVNGQERDINAVNELPQERFVLSMVNLTQGEKLSDDGLAHFKDCTGLKALYLSGPLVTDARLANFQNCKSLTDLRMPFTPVTDAGVAHFKNCQELRQLDLMSTAVTDAGLTHFQGCQHLIDLCLYGTRVSDVGLANFKDCKQLATLRLEGTQVTDAGLAYFKDCKDLYKLLLNGTQVTDAGLAHFRDCKKFGWIHLADTQVTVAGLLNFKDSKSPYFDLRGTQISDADLKELAAMSTLFGLDLRGTKVTPAGIAELKKALPNCPIQHDGNADADRRAAEWVLSVAGTVRVNGQELDINAVDALPKEKFVLTMVRLVRNQLTDEGLAHLRHCKGLMVLHLAGSLVTDERLASFEGCKNLFWLGLLNTAVTDAGLAHFKDCKGLVHLDLTSSDVTDEGLVHFKDCKKLMVLTLTDTRVTDAGLAHFQGCRDLTGLGLQGTRVTGTGLAYCKGWPKLDGLNLAGTEVTDADLAFLKDCQNLTHLTLASSTKVTDAGLAHVGKLSRLWWLELNQTGLTDEGMLHLAQLRNLAAVNLTGTKVTDAGLVHFKELQHLEAITLIDTQIGDASIDVIAGWRKLIHVRLQGSKVTDAGIKQLKAKRPDLRIEWDGGVIEPVLARINDYDALATGRWVSVLRTPGEKTALRNASIREGVIEMQDGHAYDSSIMAGDLIVRAKVQKLRGQNVMLTLRDVLGVYYSAFYSFEGDEHFGFGMRGVRFRYGVKQQFKAPAGVAEGEFFELAFAAIGDTLTLYANGKQVGQIRDSDISRPGGVAAHTTKGKGVFKDVEVMVLDKSAAQSAGDAKR